MYIDGDFEKILDIIDINYQGWQKHVLLHTCMQAWENPKNIFIANTTTHKCQL